jgi:hypothetical protein
MPQDALARRLFWVTWLRVAAFTALLGVTLGLSASGRLSAYPVTRTILLDTIVAAYTLAALHAAVLRWSGRARLVAYTQVAFDQCLWTSIVYVSGGASSGATSFYGLTVLVAAILLGLRGAIFAASIGLALYGGLCVALARGLVLPPADQFALTFVRAPADASFPALLNGTGIVVVLLLAGYLAERLRATGGALEVATQRYNEAERLAELGKIAAWLAHEIRNPLGSISGSIELLRESPAISAVDRQLCDIVLREASRLNGLVGDMVDLSKPRSPTAEAVDIAELARDLVALAKRSAAAKGGVQVVYDGPEGHVLARCDGAQIRQVGWNLVRNALQSSSSGSVVIVGVSAKDGRVCLAFDDEGPGIDAAARQRIFDAFYTTRAHGTGIGLAVVKRIIDDHEKMGASIELVASAEGGASFRVSLSQDIAGLRLATASIAPPRIA